MNKKIFQIYFLFGLLFPTLVFATSSSQIVTSSNETATAIGTTILNEGGSAADAAIATSLALWVLEPQRAGPGGGGLALIFDASTYQSFTWDFLPTAPQNACTANAPATEIRKSQTGIYSIAVPHALEGLWMLHQRLGRLPWARLVTPALQLATDGFLPSQALKSAVINSKERFLDPVFQKQYVQTISLTGQEKINSPLLKIFFEQLINQNKTKNPQIDLSKIWNKALKKQKSLLTSEDFLKNTSINRDVKKTFFKDHLIFLPDLPLPIISYFEELMANVSKKNRSFDPKMKDEFFSQILWETFQKSITQSSSFLTLTDSTQIQQHHVASVIVVDKQGSIVNLAQTLGSEFGSGIAEPTHGFVFNNAMAYYPLHQSVPLAELMALGKRPFLPLLPIMSFKGFDFEWAANGQGQISLPQNLFFIALDDYTKEGLSEKDKGRPHLYIVDTKTVVLDPDYDTKNISDVISVKPTQSPRHVGEIILVTRHKKNLRSFKRSHAEK